MEIARKDSNFKDHEYQMEEALQKMRRQLISLMEEDECLQCLRASRCCCPQPPLPQELQVYQLFDYGVYSQSFQHPPPASQVPKPYWIHGNWVPNDDLARAWMEIRVQNMNKSWEQAKASADMIQTPKRTSVEAARKAFRDKINNWFDAMENEVTKVRVKVKDDKEKLDSLPPVWPPTEQSPWRQMRENPKEKNKEVNNSVAAFFKKFATSNQTTVCTNKMAEGIFLPAPLPIVATRMNIAYNGLPVLPNNGVTFGLMTNYAV